MKINDAGLALIKAHEGVRFKAYRDPVGVLTVGFGHTSAAGDPKVTEGMTISPAEAESILRNDIAKFERYVMDAVDVPINENQFAALVSFCFNVGPGAFRGSSVLRYVNDRNFAGVPARLALWNKGGGKVWPGLVKRRADEGKLFMAPVAPQKPVRPPKPLPPVMPPPDIDPAPEPDDKPAKPLSPWQKLTGAVGAAALAASAWIADNAELVMGGLAVAVVAAVGVVIWRRR